jgi:hypothetical protein
LAECLESSRNYLAVRATPPRPSTSEILLFFSIFPLTPPPSVSVGTLYIYNGILSNDEKGWNHLIFLIFTFLSLWNQINKFLSFTSKAKINHYYFISDIFRSLFKHDNKLKIQLLIHCTIETKVWTVNFETRWIWTCIYIRFVNRGHGEVVKEINQVENLVRLSPYMAPHLFLNWNVHLLVQTQIINFTAIEAPKNFWGDCVIIDICWLFFSSCSSAHDTP